MPAPASSLPLAEPDDDGAAAEADEAGKPQRAVQSVEVGGRLLLALAAQPAPMALKDLAARAGLSASRAHPYLVSFGRLGLIEQDPVSQRYALGPAALQIGLACLHQLDPIKVATPVAEALAERFNQAVAIAVWANFGATIVRLIEGRRPLHVNMRVGMVMSLYGTATGRAFAAVLPAERLERALAGPLGDLPEAAAQSLAAPREERLHCVDEWRREGVMRAAGRPIPGVNALSAPVFDHEGAPALVITMLGPQDTLPIEPGAAAVDAVRAAAAEVSARLGWQVQAREPANQGARRDA